MNELKIFENVCNETTNMNDGTSYTISAICDDNGEFEIVITGSGGVENATRAVERAKEITDSGRI